MSKTAFKWSLAIIALAMLSLLSVIGKPGFQAQQAQRTSTAQPWSPEQYRDFIRKVYHYCDHLPVGHPDRPADHLCSAPRR